MASLEHSLQQWARRIRRRRALLRLWSWLWPVLLGVAVVTLVGLWVPLAAVLPVSPTLALALVLGIGALVALVQAARATCTLEEAAQWADLRLGSQALFVTAQGLMGQEGLAAAERACLDRAALEAAQIQPQQIAPLRYGWRWSLALTPLLVIAGLVVAPWAIDQAGQQDQEALAKATTTVQALEKRSQVLKSQGAPVPAEVTKKLRRLRKRLEAQEATRMQAAEMIQEIKKELRAQRPTRSKQARPGEAASAASNELSRSKSTEALSKAMARAARAKTAKERSDAAKEVKEATRRLSSLERASKQEAKGSLERAAKAAQALGDPKLAEALQQASDALGGEGAQGLEAAAKSLRQATNKPLSQDQLDALAKDLEDLQRQLAQGSGRQGQGQGEGQRGQGGEERIAPGPRQWSKGEGPGQPGAGGEPGGKPGSNAGQGHSEAESPAFKTGDHKDALRFGDKVPEDWEELYKDMAEAQLLNSPDRITTRVKGEKGAGGEVLTAKGGEQAPRAEEAKRALQRLPVQYTRQAREDVGKEQVPPAYRDAVRDYFNTER